MPTDEAEDNKAYCKAYYQKVKADPAKYAKRIAAISEARRRRRASGVSPQSKTCEAPVTSPVATPVKQAAVSQAPKRPLTARDVKIMAQERAAIMEADGGLSRAAAESATVNALVKELGDEVLTIQDLFTFEKD